jgi:hypothetical protein
MIASAGEFPEANPCAAQQEAEDIQNQAHEQAAGTTRTRRDLSPSPPTQAPSPDEDSSPNT